jgi:hypothetical protein
VVLCRAGSWHRRHPSHLLAVELGAARSLSRCCSPRSFRSRC